MIVAQVRGVRARDNAPMTRLKTGIAALAAAAGVACGAACSPTLDWREFVPEGSELRVTFPCRPDRHARAVVVAGAKVQMEMLICTAGDATYALSFADLADPARISAALAELRAAAVSNLQGRETGLAPLQVQGMTPNPQALRLVVSGRLPDGATVQEHAAFFTRGLRVYQATVIGSKPAPPAVETFLAGLKFPA